MDPDQTSAKNMDPDPDPTKNCFNIAKNDQIFDITDPDPDPY